MLYSPTWTKETKADVFTLASLIAWLETMPPNGEYDFYSKTGKCLLDRYLASHGLPGLASGYDHAGFRNYHRLACILLNSDDVVSNVVSVSGIANTVVSEIANNAPMTFGAALDRARRFAGGRA